MCRRVKFYVAILPGGLYNKAQLSKAVFPPLRAGWTAEVFMFLSSAVNSILALNIILVLVRIIFARKKNNVFGHA
jgi:hypothetical protein